MEDDQPAGPSMGNDQPTPLVGLENFNGHEYLLNITDFDFDEKKTYLIWNFLLICIPHKNNRKVHRKSKWCEQGGICCCTNTYTN